MANQRPILLHETQPDAAPPTGYVRQEAQLELLTGPAVLWVDVPDKRMRLAEIIPFARALCDLTVADCLARARSEGRTISCSKGCSRCCREQLVAVSPPEAFALLENLAAMPPGRRARFSTRLAETERAASEAGFLDLLPPDGRLDADGRARLSRAWTKLALPCPFLEEDETCGIHPLRPMKCREFHVSSPPELCGTAQERWEVPTIRLDGALCRLAGELEGQGEQVAMLQLIVPWWAAQRPRMQRTWRAPDMIARLLEICREQAASTPAPDGARQ